MATPGPSSFPGQSLPPSRSAASCGTRPPAWSLGTVITKARLVNSGAEGPPWSPSRRGSGLQSHEVIANAHGVWFRVARAQSLVDGEGGTGGGRHGWAFRDDFSQRDD